MLNSVCSGRIIMHYRTSRPLKLTESDFAKNWAAAMKHFSKNHEKNAREDARRMKELEQEKENRMAALAEVQEGNICFTLKTEAGTLSYSQNESATYTDFVRASIDLLLAFNGSDIDPNFKKVIQHAMEAYANGDADFFDFENDDEDNDYIERALKAQQEQLEEAKKYVATLPQNEFLTLRILSCDTNDHRIENQFTRHTDFPPNVVHGIIYDHTSFELPFEKATKLYVDLRMLEVILSVKIPQNDKTAFVKKSACRKSVRNNKTSELTGKELLKPEDGVVS